MAHCPVFRTLRGEAKYSPFPERHYLLNKEVFLFAVMVLFAQTSVRAFFAGLCSHESTGQLNGQDTMAGEKTMPLMTRMDQHENFS